MKNKKNIRNHLYFLTKRSEIYLKHYDNVLIFGDQNSRISESYLTDFWKVTNINSLVKSPTCFENPSNPSFIELCVTNCPSCFAKTPKFKTGISDFHKTFVTVLKIHYKKQKAKIIQYTNYKQFVDKAFKTKLNNMLLETALKHAESNKFTDIFKLVLRKRATTKPRYIRTNNSNSMTRQLIKETRIAKIACKLRRFIPEELVFTSKS